MALVITEIHIFYDSKDTQETKSGLMESFIQQRFTKIAEVKDGTQTVIAVTLQGQPQLLAGVLRKENREQKRHPDEDNVFQFNPAGGLK
jgi:hypothetical protein